MTTRRWGKVLGVLLLAGLLVACGAAKGEKKGKGGGKGELKAKLLAEEGASALQRQDLVTAMEKYVLTPLFQGCSDLSGVHCQVLQGRQGRPRVL